MASYENLSVNPPNLAPVVEFLFSRFLSIVQNQGFASSVFQQLRITSVEYFGDVKEEDGLLITGKGAGAKVIGEITVAEDMTNAGGNMHGGCTAYLLDTFTSLPIQVLANLETGDWVTSGVSSSLSVSYLLPMPLGKTFKLIATTLSVGKRLAVVDFRVEDDNGRCYAAGQHTKVDVKPRSSKL